MQFMIIVKANQATEASELPSQELLEQMGQFNEDLAKAGILLSGEGLHASSRGARVLFSGPQRSVQLGPFPETRQLVAGFWIWKCKSLEEAIEWVKRCPNPTGESSEIEIRQILSAEDFGPEFTPELQEKEERLREQLALQERQNLSE